MHVLLIRALPLMFGNAHTSLSMAPTSTMKLCELS